MPDTGATGAQCHPDTDLAVGGVSKSGIFMHPPYMGGVGYTWAEFGPITLPAAPSEFAAFVGIRDGGDPSDGVLFRVEVTDSQGRRHSLGDMLGVQKAWRPFNVDLSPFAGQSVRLRLIADVGPHDNATADWASWGSPVLRVIAPRTRTEVTDPPPGP